MKNKDVFNLLKATVREEYDVIEQIGEGTYGLVFKAKRLLDDELVAIKWLKPIFLQDERAKRRLMREYQILTELANSQIVHAHSIRLEGPAYYLVLDYVDSPSADKVVNSVGPLPSQEVCSIGIQVSTILEAAHEKKIIHRDVKPSNILLTETGAKLADFGLGLILGSPGTTREGELIGSVETMPPEQLLGNRIDESVDIYALGATLYHLATGYQYLPFTTNLATNIRLVLDRWGLTPPHLVNPHVTIPLSDAIVRALSLLPSERFRTATEFREALERAHFSDSNDNLHSTARALGVGIPRRAPEVISSGSIALDLALGVGGWPRSHISELYGPESSGKTTLAMHLIAEAQKLGGTGAILDADHAIDPYIAERHGVDIDNVYFVRPMNLEEAFLVVEELLKGNAVDVIIVDSIASLLPRERLEGDIQGSEEDPLHTQIVKNGLRRLLVHLDRSRAVLLFINQLDVKTGVMFGNPEVTAFGTHGLRYMASIRVDLRPTDSIKRGEEVIGTRIRARVKKNRLAPPFRKAEYDLMFDHGISWVGDLLDLGVEYEIIQKRRSFYSYKGSKLGQGREYAKQFLTENSKLAAEIKKEIWEKAASIGTSNGNQNTKSEADETGTDEFDADENDSFGAAFATRPQVPFAFMEESRVQIPPQVSPVQRVKLIELYRTIYGVSENEAQQGVDQLFLANFKHSMDEATYEEGALITGQLLSTFRQD